MKLHNIKFETTNKIVLTPLPKINWFNEVICINDFIHIEGEYYKDEVIYCESLYGKVSDIDPTNHTIVLDVSNGNEDNPKSIQIKLTDSTLLFKDKEAILYDNLGVYSNDKIDYVDFTLNSDNMADFDFTNNLGIIFRNTDSWTETVNEYGDTIWEFIYDAHTDKIINRVSAILSSIDSYRDWIKSNIKLDIGMLKSSFISNHTTSGYRIRLTSNRIPDNPIILMLKFYPKETGMYSIPTIGLILSNRNTIYNQKGIDFRFIDISGVNLQFVGDPKTAFKYVATIPLPTDVKILDVLARCSMDVSHIPFIDKNKCEFDDWIPGTSYITIRCSHDILYEIKCGLFKIIVGMVIEYNKQTERER